MTTWNTTANDVTWTAVDDPSVTWTVQVNPNVTQVGGATTLDGLTDVVITAAASGDILRHNGTNWVDTPGTTHFAAASHNHSGADITSGTVGTARLGSGTANSSTFLRGDGSWATPPGGTVDVVSNVASGVILGRTAVGAGDSEELSVSTVRTLLKTPQSSDDTVLDIRVMTQAAYNAITPSSTTLYFISG